jgi:hypothetical protein
VARLVRIAIWVLVLEILALAYLHGRDYVRTHPQDVPWTELRLDDPVGAFTLRKLVALAEEPGACRALLAEAGAGDTPAPPLRSGEDCGYGNGMRLTATEGEASLAPAAVVTSCPVAAALVVFERQVVQPAAVRNLGRPVTAMTHAGSYGCRRLYGRAEGEFSEHATANAIDVTGFQLADGLTVSVLRDWRSQGPKGRFLRDVRDGSCRIFSTALSPDYNAAHADHFHLDQARRGMSGFSVCR